MTQVNRSDEEEKVFGCLRDRVDALLENFGRPDSLVREGDYFVHADYGGYPQVVAFIHDFQLLRPEIVTALQLLVKDFPGWEIEVTVAVRGHYEDWPNMGLYIRPHEIIDGLQRQYFPEEFQSFEYEGARRGTADD